MELAFLTIVEKQCCPQRVNYFLSYPLCTCLGPLNKNIRPLGIMLPLVHSFLPREKEWPTYMSILENGLQDTFTGLIQTVTHLPLCSATLDQLGSERRLFSPAALLLLDECSTEWMLILPHKSCTTLGTLFNLLVPLYSYLGSEHHNNAYLEVLFWELSF